MKNLKILVNVPHGIGGVADYYDSLESKFVYDVKYFYMGGKSRLKFFFIWQLLDFLRFVIIIVKKKPQIIHLNPSLDTKSIFRDSIYLLISKVLRKQTLVFWRGWRVDVEHKISKKYSQLFRFIYNNADLHLVLCKDFQKKLIQWGITKRIYIETTKVDDALIKDLFIDNKVICNTILYLSRIEKEKGIFEAIKAVEKLNNCELIVAGIGSELDSAKKYVNEKALANVKFIGYVKGKDKKEIFERSSLFLFPSYHGEGMPNSVLEAMTSGLAIITRPVGGIKDFFEDGKMGFITESKDPKVFADLIEKLLSDKDILRKIGRYNHKYAIKRFLASEVAKRLEHIYQEIMSY